MNWKLYVFDYPLGNLTEGYHRHHLNADIRQSIAIGSLWLIPSTLFIITDYLHYASHPLFMQLLSLRMLFIVVLLVGFLILRKCQTYSAYSWLTFALVSFALANVLWVRMMRMTINPYYVGLDYIILLSIYLLIPNTMLLRTLPCLLFSLFNLISYHSMGLALTKTDLSILLISHLFANCLGIIASSQFYTFRSQQYETQARAQELRKDLIQNALLDELTGVANRRHFFHSAEEEFERFHRYKHPFSLLMLDLDHFKRINDQFGHPIGDKVLKDLSIVVDRCKRDTDLFGRLGGEEFALLLPETGLSGATDIAVRLRRACHGIRIPGAADKRITISIGATQARLDDADFDDVLSRADAALYRAKNNGRDRVEVD